jgi:hypothetical protein
MVPKFHTLVLGGTDARATASLAESARNALLISLREKLLSTTANPVQILLEPQGMEPLAVSLSMLSRGGAAVGTWFRNISIRNSKVVGGSMDAVSLLLSGEFLDSYVIEAAKAWRDAEGNPLPFTAEWYEKINSAPKPLLANLCVVQDVAIDPVFAAASELLAQSFFELRDRQQTVAG